jgi:hypothetical protein
MDRMPGLWTGRCQRCDYWAKTSTQAATLRWMACHICLGLRWGNSGSRVVIRKDREPTTFT